MMAGQICGGAAARDASACNDACDGGYVVCHWKKRGFYKTLPNDITNSNSFMYENLKTLQEMLTEVIIISEMPKMLIKNADCKIVEQIVEQSRRSD